MWYIIVFVIAYVVAAAVKPKIQEQQPASLGDFQAPTAEPGRPIPVIFGTVYLQSPNVVWYGDLGYVAVKSGGK